MIIFCNVSEVAVSRDEEREAKAMKSCWDQKSGVIEFMECKAPENIGKCLGSVGGGGVSGVSQGDPQRIYVGVDWWEHQWKRKTRYIELCEINSSKARAAIQEDHESTDVLRDAILAIERAQIIPGQLRRFPCAGSSQGNLG